MKHDEDENLTREQKIALGYEGHDLEEKDWERNLRAVGLVLAPDGRYSAMRELMACPLVWRGQIITLSLLLGIAPPDTKRDKPQTETLVTPDQICKTVKRYGVWGRNQADGFVNASDDGQQEVFLRCELATEAFTQWRNAPARLHLTNQEIMAMGSEPIVYRLRDFGWPTYEFPDFFGDPGNTQIAKNFPDDKTRLEWKAQMRLEASQMLLAGKLDKMAESRDNQDSPVKADIKTTGNSGNSKLRNSRPTTKEVREKLLADIVDALEKFAQSEDRIFDRHEMPGPCGKSWDDAGSFHWLCGSIDAKFKRARHTFSNHRKGICAIQKYARPDSAFYEKALPFVKERIAPLSNKREK